MINLVSKPPTGKKEVLLNRRTMGVTDAATWLSTRLSPATGISLLASGTLQSAWDVDKDGWGDQAEARRWGLRPRLATVDDRGRALFVTAGYGYDKRDGGTLVFAQLVQPTGGVCDVQLHRHFGSVERLFRSRRSFLYFHDGG